MTEQHILDPERVYEPEQQISSRRDNRREYRLQLLLTITALMCSSVEVELLQRLDGMRKYMTLSEIFWDASVALLVVFGVIIGWWLCLLLTARIADIVPWTARHCKSVVWRVGLAVP